MSFGERIRVTLFGSSHGPEVGAVLEGIPPNLSIDLERIQAELDRRRPVGRRLATKRQEEDRLVVDSGIQNARTDGSPIRAHVANEDIQRGAYDRLRFTPRPGHADYPARLRYGNSADLSGGGIFSGRMTVGLVFAGAVARQLIEAKGVHVVSFTKSIGAANAKVDDERPLTQRGEISRSNEVGSPDLEAARAMEEEIASARREGDSVGGIVETRAEGLPVGVGEPFFDSLESAMSHAIFAIPAVKAIEFGAGFECAGMRGSQHNDPFFFRDGRVETRTNHAGGILGGLSTGMPLVFRVAIKPTSSIAREQESVDLVSRQVVRLTVAGRHDPCIVPRAVVVVESVTAWVLADLMARGGFLR